MDERRATNLGFFAALPSDLVISILARLPVRTIVNCKCVCKSWLGLITSVEFSMFHLSKSVPSLAIYDMSLHKRPSPFGMLSVDRVSHSGLRDGTAYSLFEVEEGLDRQLFFKAVVKLNFPNHERLSIRGSAYGLLLLLDNTSLEHGFFHVCNPITREYVRLPYPQPASSKKNDITYGFGASKITGQLKVVRIFRVWDGNHEFECHSEVHTLGTRSWRRTAFPAALKYGINKCGLLLDGNLHWPVRDSNGHLRISCFHLETEAFSIVPTPTVSSGTSFAVLGSYLCLCDNTGNDMVVWLMKEYGVEQSWTKEFVISDCSRLCDYHGMPIIFYPIRILNDGTILLRTGNKNFMVWCDKEIGRFREPKTNGISPEMACRNFFLHTPSFVSLKSFGMENVGSL